MHLPAGTRAGDVEMGTLGAGGFVPGWPGAGIFPPQPRRGGSVRTEIIEGSGHGPLFAAAERWAAMFWEHMRAAG